MTSLGQLAQGAVATTAAGLRRARQSRGAVGYVGWVGRGNLGDEAMYQAALQLFAPRHVEIFGGGRSENALAGLGLSGRPFFDRVVLGGGTLINSGYVNIVERAHRMDLPVSALGTGVGSSGFGETAEMPPRAWKQSLKKFERIGVRGYRSKRKLEELGIEHVEVAGDLALALTSDRAAVLGDTGSFILNVAVPGVNAPEFPSGQMIDGIAQACRQLGRLGYRPVPVAFAEEDIAPIEATLLQAGIAPIQIRLPVTVSAYLTLACKARFAIGVRLHCSVLSACVGLPSVMIAYREKCHDFAETAGIEPWLIDASKVSAAELAACARELAARADSVGRDIHRRAKAWKKKLEDFAVTIAGSAHSVGNAG